MTSKRMLEVLSPDEFKAFITHEFDHGTKANNIDNMNKAVEKLAKDPAGAKGQVMRNALSRFDDFLEFAADSRAAKLYGAENMSAALQKILIAGAEENDFLKYFLFPDDVSEHSNNIGKEDIAKRVAEIANGTFQFPKESSGFQFSERLRRLATQQAATTRTI